LAGDLEDACDAEVMLANDANCFATSEAMDGAGAGARIVFGCILGTGCGGGICIDRTPHAGRNGIGSELGLNPLPWPDADEQRDPMPSGAFRDGVIDAWCSGTGLAKEHARSTGDTVDAAEVFARASKGDAAAEHSVARYESRLARSLALVVNMIDPDIIVLGGGVSKAARIYDAIPRLWAENPSWIAGGVCDTPVLPAVHGDDSGKRGAAWLWRS
ncbi:MAG: ROK family protein, partial [Planctomycetota bacterium]